jgi:hypothetical protein
MSASSARATARKSSTNASGSPWKLPTLTTSSSSANTTGLSVTAPSSRSTTLLAKPITSRQAPWTWGAQRSE